MANDSFMTAATTVAYDGPMLLGTSVAITA